MGTATSGRSLMIRPVRVQQPFSACHCASTVLVVCFSAGRSLTKQLLAIAVTAVIRWPLRVRMASDVAQAMHYLHGRSMVRFACVSNAFPPPFVAKALPFACASTGAQGPQVGQCACG